MGAVSAAGVGVEALRSLLLSGRTGLVPMTRFVPSEGVVPAGLAPGEHPPPKRDTDPTWAGRLGLHFGELAGREALAGQPASPPIALVVGTNLEDHPLALDDLGAWLAARLGITGPVVVCSTACASSTTAIGHALALLDEGSVSRVLVGGLDVISPRLHAGFARLGAVSTIPCVPFGEEIGLSLGDGAAFLLIERALPKGDETAVLGWGLSADAWHPTAPAPNGHGVEAALRRAMVEAEIEKLDYINAHGTGTEANDAAEWRGIQKAIGAPIPCSSTKSVLGHTQGAAGALELVATLICRAEGRIPHTAGFTAPRPGAPPDPVASPTPRLGPCETVASVNLGFGGVNAAVVVGRPRSRRTTWRPVYLAGAGVVAPVAGETRVPFAGLARDLRGINPRELDPATWLLLAAIARAWRDQGGAPDREARAATGLILGQPWASPDRLSRLERRIDDRGLDDMGAILFTRALQVVPAGAAAIEHGLRGPLDVIVGDWVSGLAAVTHAAWLLARDPALHGMLAGGVDEGMKGTAWEGAAVLSLTAAPSPVRLAGWARARTGEEAKARAMAMAEVDAPGWTPPPGRIGASVGVLACAEALRHLEKGDSDTATIVVEGPARLAAAVVLRRS